MLQPEQIGVKTQGAARRPLRTAIEGRAVNAGDVILSLSSDYYVMMDAKRWRAMDAFTRQAVKEELARYIPAEAPKVEAAAVATGRMEYEQMKDSDLRKLATERHVDMVNRKGRDSLIKALVAQDAMGSAVVVEPSSEIEATAEAVAAPVPAEATGKKG